MSVRFVIRFFDDASRQCQSARSGYMFENRADTSDAAFGQPRIPHRAAHISESMRPGVVRVDVPIDRHPAADFPGARKGMASHCIETLSHVRVVWTFMTMADSLTTVHRNKTRLWICEDSILTICQVQCDQWSLRSVDRHRPHKSFAFE
jgi:hypothetical protein